MATKQGVCHICGFKGDITLEHIPPKAAFNNRRTIRLKFEDVIELGPDAEPKGPIQQGGVGFYTLCAKCNNITGHWYGNHFVNWCYESMSILEKTNGRASLINFNYIFPLSIIKQIITMFFSVNSPNFRTSHPELVRFILNRDAKYLPEKYRFYAYYNISNKMRYIGLTGIANFHSKETKLISEICYPPFGYVMTLDSLPSEQRLYDITYFSRYAYNEFAVLHIKMPVLPIETFIPGDYRSTPEIMRDYAENLRIEKEMSAENTT